jgi:hypothetical protein
MGPGMNAFVLRMAIAIARSWTRAYTRGLPSAHAGARRAEIESDLWELQRDADRGRVRSPAAQVLGRLILGAADDVCWRLEQVSIADSVAARRTIAYMAAALSMTAVLWIGVLTNTSDVNARARVHDCARPIAPVDTTADLRLRVVSCAGAFFLPAATPSIPSR